MDYETVSLVGDEIIIKISLSELDFAVNTVWDRYYGYEQHDLFIENRGEFIKELMLELEAEINEDGDTLITKMLDDAIISMTETGWALEGYKSLLEPVYLNGKIMKTWTLTEARENARLT